MIAGGSEAAVCQLGYAGFCSMKAMSTNFNQSPEEASRPFELERWICHGRGCGGTHFGNFGARPLSSDLLWNSDDSSCDAYHITSPDPEGQALAKSMKSVVERAGLSLDSVDYINAHGTSTP